MDLDPALDMDLDPALFFSGFPDANKNASFVKLFF
jgi:hypothetical protein